MKTYIINEFRRLKSIANKKDFVSFVQNSEWMVFNEDKDEIEKFIFVDKDNVLISFTGSRNMQSGNFFLLIFLLCWILKKKKSCL